jgi:transposase-like protein
MMNPGSYDINTMTIAQLCDLREWQLERLDRVTAELKQQVRAQAEQGKNVSSLAKEANVTRRTIYAWLEQ